MVVPGQGPETVGVEAPAFERYPHSAIQMRVFVPYNAIPSRHNNVSTQLPTQTANQKQTALKSGVTESGLEN